MNERDFNIWLMQHCYSQPDAPDTVLPAKPINMLACARCQAVEPESDLSRGICRVCQETPIGYLLDGIFNCMACLTHAERPISEGVRVIIGNVWQYSQNCHVCGKVALAGPFNTQLYDRPSKIASKPTVAPESDRYTSHPIISSVLFLVAQNADHTTERNYKGPNTKDRDHFRNMASFYERYGYLERSQMLSLIAPEHAWDTSGRDGNGKVIKHKLGPTGRTRLGKYAKTQLMPAGIISSILDLRI